MFKLRKEKGYGIAHINKYTGKELGWHKKMDRIREVERDREREREKSRDDKMRMQIK